MPRLLPDKLIAALQADTLRPLVVGADLAAESRRRIRIAAALGATAYATFFLVLLRAPPPDAARLLERHIDVTHDIVGVGVCLVLLLLSVSRSFDHRRLFAAALAIEFSLCLLISVAVPWTSFLRTGHIPGITWVVPIIILFPSLVPAGPRTTILASASCAAAALLGPWSLRASGRIDVPAIEIITTGITAFVGAGIAVVVSNTVHAARREAAAARRAGGYELLERLAEGGMGEIWKARHVMLARPAAIKLILPEMLQGPLEERETVKTRFMREARINAGLRSAHTVNVFDFGVSGDGRFYIAMELLEGINAEHFVYHYGALPPARAVHWLLQASESLGEAHALGLVHRDVKPGNLMVCHYGRDLDFIKVLDFGLTRPAVGGDTGLTRDGRPAGTPGFMAPEQVYGVELDARTDVYALGCVGYWLLSGRKPFEADTSGELMKMHVESPPPRLSDRMEQPVPQRLEALLLECLAKTPEQRPRDADTLHARLADCLDGARWTNADAEAWWS